MPYGEGANWEGNTHIAVRDGVNFEVRIESTPLVGVVRVSFDSGDGPSDIATKLAKEWNEREPILDVFAVAEPGSSLTAFFLKGPLANGAHKIVAMAATFDGKLREEMPNVGDSVLSFRNNGISVTRTAIRIHSATGRAVNKSAAGVVGGAKTSDPVLS